RAPPCSERGPPGRRVVRIAPRRLEVRAPKSAASSKMVFSAYSAVCPLLFLVAALPLCEIPGLARLRPVRALKPVEELPFRVGVCEVLLPCFQRPLAELEAK